MDVGNMVQKNSHLQKVDVSILFNGDFSGACVFTRFFFILSVKRRWMLGICSKRTATFKKWLSLFYLPATFLVRFGFSGAASSGAEVSSTVRAGSGSDSATGSG